LLPGFVQLHMEGTDESCGDQAHQDGADAVGTQDRAKRRSSHCIAPAGT
jgi:hypothetical protein